MSRSRRGRIGSNVAALLTSAVLGALLFSLFDPDRGRGRRAVARDKTMRAARRSRERLGAASRDVRNRTQGLVSRAGSLLKVVRGEAGIEAEGAPPSCQSPNDEAVSRESTGPHGKGEL